MAKKSAKSKGFRKQQTKKPYLSKRDVIILCVLVVLLIIAAVVAATYSDGALKVKDGRVVDAGENWIIVNGSGTPGRARYFKVGEAGDIDGYTCANNPLADPNVPQYVYTPAAEDAPVNSLSVTASHNAAKALSEYIGKTVGAIPGTEVTEAAEGEVNGTAYRYLTSVADLNAGKETAADETADVADAEAAPEEGEGEASEEETAPAEEETAEEEAETVEEEAAPADAEAAPAEEDAVSDDDEAADEDAEDAEAAPADNFSESFYAFVDCAHDSCVVIDVNATAETREALPDEAAMRAIVEQAIAAITLEPAK